MSGMPITAGDTPEPLPSVLLDPSGIAAWVLRPGDLDRLPVLSTEPPPEPPQRSRVARALRDDPPNAQLLSSPHRPHPEADSWPDDAVLITYSELRRLIALHLETCGRTMPSAEPWRFVQMRAAGMRDGEVPLLLSEVLE